ncbi:MAG: gliding motility-associated C-terminal domain-containing protein [Chitinophagaceae bacterium]|nr:gliding motility-associated C-terminal domain-containing protein [Chitinophagaceae bacterium]MCW5906109.1 gliding motility-associated C-terminal domain-containing protein [Chitinophagaceae bacterium]
MQKLFTYLLLLFLWTFTIEKTVFAQTTAPAIEWAKCYGGSGFDYAYDIKQTIDGGYIVAGETFSNDGDVNSNHGSGDYWIVKLGALGNIEWQKCLGGSNYEVANSIQQTTDGGYIVAGETYSNDGDVTGNHGYNDYWIVKLGALGNIEWQKCLGGSGYDYAYSIQQTTDGGYIVAGHSNSNNGDVSGNHGNPDYWIVKLDALGNIEWQKCLGGSASDYAYSIQQTTDGGYIVAGHSNSNNGDVSGNHGNTDCWIVKLNTLGNIEWQKCLGGSLGEIAYSIQQTINGGYIVAGQTTSNDSDVNGNNGSSDYWIVKLDDSGNIEWQKCLGGSDAEYATSIQQTTDGGYIITGRTDSNDGDANGNNGSGDYWIVKLDDSGSIEWQKCLGGPSIEDATAIQQTMDGGYIVAGRAGSNNGYVNGNHGSSDFWIVKLGVAPCTPTINITASANNICANTGVTFTATTTNGGLNPTYQWKINGNNVGTNSNTYTTSSLNNNDTVICILTSNATCAFITTARDTIVMSVTPNVTPAISITANNTTICKDTNVVFTATPINGGTNPSYQWLLNGNNVGGNASTYSNAHLTNGDIVSCILTSNLSCVTNATANSNNVTITVHPNIVPTIHITTNDSIICKGDNVYFTSSTTHAGTSPSYQWTINNNNAGNHQNTFSTNSLDNNDAVRCTIISSLPCTVPASSNIIKITADEIPTLTTIPDTTIFSGSSVQLNANSTGNITSYLWTPNYKLSANNIISPIATPLATTIYNLKVTTQGGCIANDKTIITVLEKIVVPNAFSPNGDGVNDIWEIPGLSSFTNCTVDVFNRNGHIIFHSKGYSTPWNGSYNNKPVPIGTYYYIINTHNKLVPVLSGSVTILR